MREDGSEGERNKALVAEFVLGLLDASTQARVERLIADDPRLRAERDFWLNRLAPLDEQVDAVAPPPRVLADLERRLFAEPVRAGESWWNSLALWRGLAAGALAVAVVAVGVNLLEPRSDVSSLTTQLVAALEEQGSDIRFLALYDGGGTLRLTALSGSTAPDRDLELWAIQDGEVLSMGVVPIGEAIEVKLTPEIMRHWGEGSSLALTLEPKGGSPTGVATGPIVAQGAVNRI